MEHNDMENMELEQMRAQLGILKDKVDSQEIVNEHLMRKVMSDKVRRLNKNAIIVGLIAIVGMIYVPWVLGRIGFPVAFLVATALFLLLAVSYDIWSHWGIKAQNIMDGDLIDTSRRIARMKKMSQRWLFFGLPCLAAWLSWFVYEILHLPGIDREGANFMLLGGGIGAVIGATLGYNFYFKSQRQAAEVIEQINELTKE